MKIVTKAFGEMEVSEKQRVTFSSGLLGFEEIRDFILLDSPEDSPFYWLQAEHYPEIAFVLINPSMILTDYVLEADEQDLKEIDIEGDGDYITFAIVTLGNNPTTMTANLLGPIVINKKNHKGKQVISTNDTYSVRHPLLQGEGG